MMKTVAVVGSFDTKEIENRYLVERIKEYGCKVYLVDTGVLADSAIIADVTAREVAYAGGAGLSELREEKDREKSLAVMARGAAVMVRKAFDQNIIDAVIAMGGGQGTYTAAHVMRVLPVGFPKVLVSTIATSMYDQQQFEGINDTMVINPLVDVSGNNAILCMIMERAAAAIVGMVQHFKESNLDVRPKIGITMWGVTTQCVTEVQRILEENGYEVLVFHATGLGGRVMEDLAREGKLQGVVDITLAELGNQITGGSFAKCDYRCEMAGRMGIPQVIVPGGLDMIKCVPPENIPEKFKNREKYMHNSNLLFVRSDIRDNIMMGKELARKLNTAVGITTVVLPLRGISAIDKENEVFFNLDSDQALFDTLRKELKPEVSLVEYDMHINDSAFAQKVAHLMLMALKNNKQRRM